MGKGLLIKGLMKQKCEILFGRFFGGFKITSHLCIREIKPKIL